MESKLRSLCDTVLSSSSVFMTSKTPSGIKDIESTEPESRQIAKTGFLCYSFKWSSS